MVARERFLNIISNKNLTLKQQDIDKILATENFNEDTKNKLKIIYNDLYKSANRIGRVSINKLRLIAEEFETEISRISNKNKKEQLSELIANKISSNTKN